MQDATPDQTAFGRCYEKCDKQTRAVPIDILVDWSTFHVALDMMVAELEKITLTEAHVLEEILHWVHSCWWRLFDAAELTSQNSHAEKIQSLHRAHLHSSYLRGCANEYEVLKHQLTLEPSISQLVRYEESLKSMLSAMFVPEVKEPPDPIARAYVRLKEVREQWCKSHHTLQIWRTGHCSGKELQRLHCFLAASHNLRAKTDQCISRAISLQTALATAISLLLEDTTALREQQLARFLVELGENQQPKWQRVGATTRIHAIYY